MLVQITNNVIFSLEANKNIVLAKMKEEIKSLKENKTICEST